MRPQISLVLAALAVFLAPGPAAFAAEADDWHRVVGILQYLEADYPMALESGSEFELNEQDAFMEETVRAAKALGPKGAAFVPRLEALQAKVKAREAPEPLVAEFARLIEELVQAGGLSRSPKTAPDLERGAQLYAQTCATCHAADGSADVPLAKTMEPAPANFLDPEVAGALPPYKGFNVITHGLPGTMMTPFKTVYPNADDRWALAFFVLTLRHPECSAEAAKGAPKTTLEELATLSDDGLAQKYGEAALPCLRRSLPEVDEDEGLALAQSKLQQALTAWAGGDAETARRAVLDAYLLGVEPVEPLLAARDPGLVREIETHVLALRVALDKGDDEAVKTHGASLGAVLQRAREANAPVSTWSVFWMALLIVLREGFEALVVVGALLAVLKKMGATSYARIVHAGWVCALIAGAVAFFFAQKLLAGANREWMEGLVALFAVGMLLYAALWLNARANMSAFMKDLRGQVEGALGTGSAAGLFLISFSAVGRESFETALFLQALALDSASASAWGGIAGLAVLAGLVVVVLRVGFRLPMKRLFQLSTAFLYGTAVVLLGKGLHALQEVGAVPIRPIAFVQVDFLGLFPDLVTLLPQAALASAPLVYWLVRRTRTAPAEIQGAP